MTAPVEKCGGHRSQSHTCSQTTPEWCQDCGVWFGDVGIAIDWRARRSTAEAEGKRLGAVVEEAEALVAKRDGRNIGFDNATLRLAEAVDALGEGAESALVAESDHVIALQRLIEALARGEMPEATDRAPHMSQVAQRAGAKLVAACAERDDWKREANHQRETVFSYQAEAERRRVASDYWNRRAEEEHSLARELRERAERAEALLREARVDLEQHRLEYQHQHAPDLEARIDEHLGGVS